MSSSTPDLSEFLDPPLCANTDRMVDSEISPCKEKATMVCSKCFLVQYCCKACQVTDWKRHKPICTSEHLKETYLPRYVKECRIPFGGPPDQPGFDITSFGSLQYLWGNMPALDILNADKNEGKDIMKRDINLLFAASGDMRNVVKTVVGLPKGYAGNCVVVMNDWNFTITARNAMMLLAAMHFEPETAVPIIMHLWYSQVCDKIKHKSTELDQAKTFNFGDRSICLALKKGAWVELSKMFTSPDQLSSHRAMQIRQHTTCAPRRVDFVDKALYQMPPGRRTGTWKFRLEGLLVPYGTSRKPFVYPNPTFFRQQGVWPMLDDADPLSGWSYNEYITHSSAAKNDVYGAFFNFLRNLLLQFCKRVRNSKIVFRLFNVNAVNLPSYTKDIRFDRIEAANICDRAYVGISQTLKVFSPMLKAKVDNPHATILMLFLNAEVIPDKNASFLRMLRGVGKPRSLNEPPNRVLVEMVVVTDAMSMFANFDEHFNKYLQHPDLFESGSMKDFAQKYGVQVKAQHTIVKPWPCRVTDETTKAEFAILLAESTTGHERYVEFEKLEGNPKETSAWCKDIKTAYKKLALALHKLKSNITESKHQETEFPQGQVANGPGSGFSSWWREVIVQQQARAWEEALRAAGFRGQEEDPFGGRPSSPVPMAHGLEVMMTHPYTDQGYRQWSHRWSPQTGGIDYCVFCLAGHSAPNTRRCPACQAVACPTCFIAVRNLDRTVPARRGDGTRAQYIASGG
ncbi:MYND finger family protein [Pyrenophora tritici-repentis]|nr:MYND finger family protein [Pyrenophora tritici-repentis]PZD27362.1 MYND finger family protein [Pyrenophora tritici-repentis]PZD38420.1 MYND finger family protein [Pyrenophora tritici-repentis]